MPERYQLTAAGKLGTRYTLDEVGPHGARWKLGSMDIATSELGMVHEMLNMANAWYEQTEQENAMHVYNARIALGPDAIEHLTHRQHVSPAILERMLFESLSSALHELGITTIEVEHIDDIPAPVMTNPPEHLPDTMLEMVVDPTLPTVTRINKPRNYRPLVTVRDGSVIYVDEFPTLIGEAWEMAMDQYGHNVTSHLNEQGQCTRCQDLLVGTR